jgi:hypothetical protein
VLSDMAEIFRNNIYDSNNNITNFAFLKNNEKQIKMFQVENVFVIVKNGVFKTKCHHASQQNGTQPNNKNAALSLNNAENLVSLC